MRINYTDIYLEDIVLEVPWDDGFVPPPEIKIYVEIPGKGLEERIYHHRGERPIRRR